MKYTLGQNMTKLDIYLWTEWSTLLLEERCIFPVGNESDIAMIRSLWDQKL